jgi:hypothetical protein
LPERNETSRSADQPPIRTATCLAMNSPWRSRVQPLIRRDTNRIDNWRKIESLSG